MNIMKSFEFCYGHRIWNQVLNNGEECKCRFAHGHSGKIDLILESTELVRGMVVDFNELKVIKDFIDRKIDHRFLVDEKDPLLHKWLFNNEKLEFVVDSYSGIKTVGYDGLDVVDKEFFESLVILPFVPTSENLAFWMYNVSTCFIKEIECKVAVKTVRWWESAKSYAEVG